jgi:hypothetical protein
MLLMCRNANCGQPSDAREMINIIQTYSGIRPSRDLGRGSYPKDFAAKGIAKTVE